MTGAEGTIITTIYPNPCMLSHAMDPSSTDFRAFFPYTPNEVKHRKRTTSAQLKVLESIFKHDTKPNATLRKELANQLDMTPRGVQVWFQNRRAKEKNKAGKTTAGTGKTSEDASGELEHIPEDPSPAEATEGVAAEPHTHSPASTAETADTSSQASSPAFATRPFFRINTHSNATADSSANTSWQGSPVEPPPLLSSFISRSSNDLSDIQIASYRRGSLPINALLPTSPSTQPTCGPPVIDQLDPLARRRSVDASLQRLAHNPFASVARARNAQLFGSSRVVAHGHHHPAVWFGPPARPPMQHRTTLPAELDLRRTVSLSNKNASSPLSSSDSSLLSVPNHYISQRSLPSHPLPGPLPSPDFSFGAPYPTSSPPLTTPTLDHDRSSPESFQFGYRSDELETEDDASYGAATRFGSVISVASDYSVEEGMQAKLMRRDSCAPAFLEMMGNLDMSQSQAPHAPSYQDTSGNDDNSAALVNTALPVQDTSEGPSSYPSPSSTVSPGGSSPHQVSTPSNVGVNISRSSELAFALQETKAESPPLTTSSNIEQQQRSLVDVTINATTPQPEFNAGPPHQTYAIFDQGGGYSTSSTSSPPLSYPFVDTDYPTVSVSPPQHFHSPPIYNHSAPDDLSIPPHGHGIEYMHCGTVHEANVGLGVYRMYEQGGHGASLTNASNSAPSISPASIDGSLQSVETTYAYT